ncbi:MAG TPA: hypothetical protein VG498_18075 [Terriglobales bacterium]|nr:hypothetical protein [Terriglobales bacterium]
MFDFETATIKAWAGKGSIAIIDQAFTSGSNFLVSILLARWSSPQEYGAFALAFAVFLLLSQLQQSVLLEPMSVFGGAYSGSRLKRYYGSLLHMQNGLLVAITVPLALTALITQQFANGQQLAAALWGVTFASPFVMSLWMARRAFYLEHSPGPAAAGAVVYTVVTIGGLIVVRRMGEVTSFMAFLIMGIAALITTGAMFCRLRPKFRRDPGDVSFQTECMQHLRYGGWALAGALAMWVPQNIYYAILSGTAGMAAAADIRALLNLSLPLQRVALALGLLLLPYTARIHSEQGQDAAKAFTRKICYLFAGGSSIYWIVVLALRHPVFQLLYAGKYTSLISLLPWMALSSILSTVIFALVIALRAMRSPASVFYASAAAGVIAIAIGIPATWMWGVGGVIFSFIVSNVVTLIATWWLMRRGIESTKIASPEDVEPVQAFGLNAIPDAKVS